MAKAVSTVVSGSLALPALFAPDKDAARRFIEFFTANIRNPHTRRAYARAAVEFAVLRLPQSMRLYCDPHRVLRARRPTTPPGMVTAFRATSRLRVASTSTREERSR